MSRSTKKPIIKDRGCSTHMYWAPIRHNWKITLNQNYYKDDLEFKNPKKFVNDYTYSDYCFRIYAVDDYKKENWYHYHGKTTEQMKKWSRK